MIFYFPKPDFIPIAISKCKLNCKHCMGKYLKQMKQIRNAKQLMKFSEKYNGIGFLISGGFDREGRLIGLKEILLAIKELKNKFYIAIHPGFVDKKLAEEIAKACHIAFVDLPSNNAIKKVFGLKKSIDDYLKSMENLLDAGIKVSPHITVGLNFGEIEEYELLDRLKQYKIEKLVLNIVIPTTKTPFESVKVNKEEVLNFVKYTKNKIKNIAIGCMRPRDLDIDLINAGIKEMAVPSKKAIGYVKEKGIEIKRKNYCCGIKELEK